MNTVKELNISIRTHVIAYDCDTQVAKTDGKLSLSIEEVECDVMEDGRRTRKNGSRSLVWETYHETHESALTSAKHHVAGMKGAAIIAKAFGDSL